MPKKSLLYQQYRRTMGNHTNWQDKKQGSQQDQDKRAQRLALQPGLHTGNVHRHNASQAMVQLLSTLSAAQISSANPAISPQRADELSRTNPRYGGNYNRSPGTERPVPIRDPGGAMYSTSAGNFIPADSPSPSTTSMNALGYQNLQLPIHSTTNDELNFPSRSNPFSALRQKRSFFLSHNIPNKILDIISDIHFDSSLRLTLDHIRILAEQAPEVKYASEEDKNVFLLLKCIQEMNREIKDKNLPSTGEAQVMLGALFEIADSLDAPHEKTIVNEFKQRLDSERDSIGATGLSSTLPPGMLQGMHSGGGPAALAPEEQSRVMSLEQDRVYNHLLTKARAFYDIERGVLISDEQEMRVITSFLNQQIFDVSLDELCMSFVTRKSMPVSFISMELDYYVYDRIDYYYIGRQSLSVEELAFYKNHVLSKSLPTIALQLSAGENVELNNLLVTQPQWGFVHAGAMLLTDSGAGLNGLTLADITDVGITLFTMLRQRAVPQENNEYFRLPALLYYAATKPNLPDSLKLLDLDMQQVYLHYFNYIKSWEIRNNPLEGSRIQLKAGKRELNWPGNSLCVMAFLINT